MPTRPARTKKRLSNGQVLLLVWAPIVFVLVMIVAGVTALSAGLRMTVERSNEARDLAAAERHRQAVSQQLAAEYRVEREVMRAEGFYTPPEKPEALDEFHRIQAEDDAPEIMAEDPAPR